VKEVHDTPWGNEKKSFALKDESGPHLVLRSQP